jgi:hypothetical protein
MKGMAGISCFLLVTDILLGISVADKVRLIHMQHCSHVCEKDRHCKSCACAPSDGTHSHHPFCLSQEEYDDAEQLSYGRGYKVVGETWVLSTAAAATPACLARHVF